MHSVFPIGALRSGTILAYGAIIIATIGLGRASAQDACPQMCTPEPEPSIFWFGSEPAPRDSWYVSTQAFALQRIFSGLGAAATLGASPSGSVALSQQNLDDPYQAGVQMIVGHTFQNTPYQVEASYFWLNPLDEAAQTADPSVLVTSPGNLFSPFTNFGNPTADGTVDFSSEVAIRLISRLEGGEVNLKYKLCLPNGDPTISLFVGVRHIELREEFDYTSLPAPIAAVNAHTNNSLWGPQIGGVVDYGHQDIWVHCEGRAGIFDNQTDRELAANINGTSATHPKISDSNTAMAADISASIQWRPTDAITAKIGYQAMWIDELALAARNYIYDPATLTDPATAPPINHRGTLIYQGPFAGLQFGW